MNWIYIKLYLFFVFLHVDAKFCPNGKDECPAWATCCQTVNGRYGCCPYKNAQCCSDKIHCCPDGSKCNVKNQSCDYGRLHEINLKWMVPTYKQDNSLQVLAHATKPEPLSAGIKICSDGNFCQDGATCCQTPEKRFGCCPHTNGTCCSDQIHCCPKGYDCDINRNRCAKSYSKMYNFIPFLKEFPLFNMETNTSKDLPQSICKPMNKCALTNQKCCSTGSKEYCCPNGYACSKGKSVCRKEDEENSIEKSVSLKSGDLYEAQHGMGTCPDRNVCEPFYTCCPGPSGNYGCCQFPKATCCEDKKHCCPFGFTCATDGRCQLKPSILSLKKSLFVNSKMILFN